MAFLHPGQNGIIERPLLYELSSAAVHKQSKKKLRGNRRGKVQMADGISLREYVCAAFGRLNCLHIDHESLQ
jgi:hypothetical protein